MRRLWIALVAALLMVLVGGVQGAGSQAPPAAGILDTTFGCAASPCPGFNSFDLGIYLAVTVQPDGRILAAGGTDASLMIDRWEPNGVLDTTFGNDMGRANLVGDGAFSGIQLLADGKIIGGGDLDSGGGNQFVVYRLDATGAVDATFGTGGSTLGPDGDGRDLKLQPDGKIVMAGFQEPSGPFVVARYDASGAPDPTFGGGTGFTTGPGGAAFGVALQSDGKIVAAGVADAPDGMLRVARYDTSGVLDPTFGAGGVVTGPSGPSLTGSSDRDFTDVAIQPDGKILVASNDGSDPVTPNFRVVRYLTSGDLDPTFGNGGIVTGPPGLVNGNGIALMPDGKIVVGGATSEAGAPSMFRVVRYDASGTLDSQFGCAAPPCPGFGDGVASAIGISTTLQPDHRIVVVGTRLGQFGQNLPVVARFDNSEPLPVIPVTPAQPRFTG
jgi:uncharacterized delta-60 repeat protein